PCFSANLMICPNPSCTKFDKYTHLHISLFFTEDPTESPFFVVFFNRMCQRMAFSCFTSKDIRDITVYFHRGNYSQVNISHTLSTTSGARWPKCLEREFTDRKVRGSNTTSASRLPLSSLGQPGSIPAFVQPSGGMAVRHRKGATAERFCFTSGCSVAKKKPGE
ncbi:hypothetical protein CSKR_110271, partial [Clonorchis sinensis]